MYYKMHPTHSRRGAAKPKGALGIALHYLNLQAESRTWRRELAKPHEGPKRELSKGTGQLFGISSATQLREMLGEFQDFGTRILALDPSFGSAPGSARVLLLKELHRAAALSVDAFVVDRVAGCLGVSWGTQNESCKQMFYGFLALALLEAPFWPIAKCDACGVFFPKPSHRGIKYCSERCRQRIQIARYRERIRDREAQRRPSKRTARQPHRTRSTGIEAETSS